MKTILCIVLVGLVIYGNSFAMKKAICGYQNCPDRKKVDELFPVAIWQFHDGLEILEKDWKEGGHMAAHYPLGRLHSDCEGGVLSRALLKRKSADFIRYLIKSGARVDLEYEYGKDEEFYCLPIALASVYGDPDTVATIIELGGLGHFDSDQKCGSLIIRYIREAAHGRNTIANYITCIEYLIKAGCAVQPKKSAPQLYTLAFERFGALFSPGNSLFSLAKNEFTTPLMEAVNLKVPELVKLLLKHGADPDKKYDGKSARDVAQEKGLLAKGISLIYKKQEKNLLERVIDGIKEDEAKIVEEERLQQKAQAAAAIFQENKRLLGADRLIKCITNNTKLINIAYLVSLQRT